jgi:hypothetical protein
MCGTIQAEEKPGCQSGPFGLPHVDSDHSMRCAPMATSLHVKNRPTHDKEKGSGTLFSPNVNESLGKLVGSSYSWEPVANRRDCA